MTIPSSPNSARKDASSQVVPACDQAKTIASGTRPSQFHRVGKSCLPESVPAGRQGFTLVEVAMAIGIVSFCVLAILGLLPVGLSTLQDSACQQGTADVSKQISSQLQQISFNPTNAFNIQNLANTTNFYTRDGIPTNNTAAYFRASFTVGAASLNNSTVSTFDTNSGQSVTVTLSYPANAPAAGQKSNIFAIFAAKQSSD